MADTTEVTNGAAKASEVPTGLAVGRRHLLRGAVGAGPVMLTLVSRPVLAGGGRHHGTTCTTASAFGSINSSRPDTQDCSGGCTPNYWTKNPKHWPHTCKPSDPSATRFTDVFGSAGGYRGKTLMDVLKLTGGGKDALACYVSAAWLNVCAGNTPIHVLSGATVKNIWNSYVGTGHYSPTAGVQWNDSQIVTWLKTTMPRGS